MYYAWKKRVRAQFYGIKSAELASGCIVVLLIMHGGLTRKHILIIQMNPRFFRRFAGLQLL